MTDAAHRDIAHRDIAHRVAARLGWSPPGEVGAGTEFVVYASSDDHGREWALRVPHRPVYQSANNPGFEASDLQRQERALTRWAAGHDLPVSRPGRLFDVDGYTVLATELCPDDGSTVDSEELGAVLARLHAARPPVWSPVAQLGRSLPDLLADRIPQRYTALVQLLADRPSLPALPDAAWLRRTIQIGQPSPRVLHLDIRRPNVLTVAGRPRALVDWSNVLFGDPLLELARVVEYGALPENAVDADAVLVGYARRGGRLATNTPRWLVYRLDAAIMLAVVFASVAPDPDRLRLFVGRIRDLAGQL